MRKLNKRGKTMPETLVLFGFVLLIAGILLIILGSLSGAKEPKTGFGGVIGPFVFGFGNDPQLTKIAIIVSAVFAVLFLLFVLRGYF